MTHSLVLDIDGVLVRDPLLLQHVKYNVIEYVRAKLPESKNPTQVNSILYNTYGHTARGLEKAFQINARDFDEKVYDKKLIDHLWAVITANEFQEDAKIINAIEKSGWKVQLFSNSPLEWSLPVMQVLGGNVSVVKDHRWLKPNMRAYTNFSTRYNHLFVDDSMVNLHAAKLLRNWVPVYYTDEQVKTQSEFPTINSIWELGLMCETINNMGLGAITV